MEHEEGVMAKKRKLNDSSDEAEMHFEENMQEQLRQFDVLDEVHGDESGSELSEGWFFNCFISKMQSIELEFNWYFHIEYYTDCGSSDSDMDDIDIENMLDEGLPDDLRDHKKQQRYEEKYKTVLDGMDRI